MTPAQLVDKKIVIFSHYATTGACEEMRDWLLDLKIRELVYVAFPFGSNRNRFITVARYSMGVPAAPVLSLFRMKLPEPLAYIKDFLYALYYALRFAREAEFLVAGDNLLALAGAMTRWVTGVKRVVYYMIDFTPVRYANRFLNALYYSVDRLAASAVDVVWPLTEEIINGRFDAGRLSRSRVHWYPVPYGSHLQPAVPASTCDRQRVVYLGDVLRSKGAELFVPMVQELKRLVPGIRLTVIGGGKDLPALREEVKSAGLEEQFEICGFVESISDVIGQLSSAGAAIAPYYPFDTNNFTFYSDPGKIKIYLGCGLPVVLTDVPPIAKRLEHEGAGTVAPYDASAFAKAIANLLNHPGYPQMRDRARRLGEQYAWPRIFAEALSHIDAAENKKAYT